MKQIKCLGTGTIAPNPHRNSSAYLIQYEGLHILMDMGPGILRRLIESGISPYQLDYIFLTHFHMDHISDLLPFLFMHRYPTEHTRKKTTIFAHPSFLKLMPAMESLLSFSPEDLDSAEYHFIQASEQLTLSSRITVNTVSMKHKEESLGYLFEFPGKKIFFSGDTDLCTELIRSVERSNISIIECSNSEENNLDGHLNPKKIKKLMEQLSPIIYERKDIYLSHFYPEAEKSLLLEKLFIEYTCLKKTKDGQIITWE
jgi:ribonuclease BN (tRNA processing enzyme)